MGSFAAPRYLRPIGDALRDAEVEFNGALWPLLRDPTVEADRRFRAGLTLAKYDSDSRNWSPAEYTLLAEQLVAANSIHYRVLYAYLQPISTRLLPDLERIFAEHKRPESQLVGAANALAEFAGDDGARLARLLATATAGQYGILYDKVSARRGATANAVLAEIVAEEPTDNLSESGRVALGARRAGAAISLLRMGDVERSSVAFAIRDDPESLTQFIHRCRDRRVTADELVRLLRSTKDVHSRFATLLALGDYNLAEVGAGDRDALKNELIETYRRDPSSAIHGAAGWLLRTCGFKDAVRQIDHTPIAYDPTGTREWYVQEVTAKPTESPGIRSRLLGGGKEAEQKIHLTFIVFPPGEFVMGSSAGEAGRQNDEQQRRVTLTRPLAVSAHEVTWGQYNAVMGEDLNAAVGQQSGKPLSDLEPAVAVDWFDAVRFCYELTRYAGLSQSDQCYEDPATLPRDEQKNPTHTEFYRERAGFRLPTEAEWEYVCRSGMRTAYGFGSDRSLLAHYGWYSENSGQWPHSVGELRPSLRGLFDLHGNVWEWCHDWYTPQPADNELDPTGATSGSPRVFRGGGWGSDAAICRAAFRYSYAPTYRTYDFGFRLALSPSGASPEAQAGE